MVEVGWGGWCQHIVTLVRKASFPPFEGTSVYSYCGFPCGLVGKLWQVPSLKMLLLLSKHVFLVTVSAAREEGGRVTEGNGHSAIPLKPQLYE